MPPEEIQHLEVFRQVLERPLVQDTQTLLQARRSQQAAMQEREAEKAEVPGPLANRQAAQVAIPQVHAITTIPTILRTTETNMTQKDNIAYPGTRGVQVAAVQEETRGTTAEETVEPLHAPVFPLIITQARHLAPFGHHTEVMAGRGPMACVEVNMGSLALAAAAVVAAAEQRLRLSMLGQVLHLP